MAANLSNRALTWVLQAQFLTEVSKAYFRCRQGFGLLTMDCTRIVRCWRYRILAASSVILVVILFPLALLRSTRLEQEPAVNTTTNLPRFQYNSTQPSTIKALKKLCISKAWDKDLIFSCYDVLVTNAKYLRGYCN